MTNVEPSSEDLARRKARQYAVLHRLTDLGMELAEIAHAKAKAQLAAPAPTSAHARARGAEPFDYFATFASMSRAVRQAVALEMRLDAPPRTRPAFKPFIRSADPRRPLLRRVFHDAVARDPDAPRLRRTIDWHIDQRLDADPECQEPIAETLAALCNVLSIDLDPARLPDELLDVTPPPLQADRIPPARAAP